MADVNHVRPTLIKYFFDNSQGVGRTNGLRPHPQIMRINQRDTPLSLACAQSDWGFAEWLLENGADPGALDGRAYEVEGSSALPSEDGTSSTGRLAELVESVRLQMAEKEETKTM
ncbi:hypothetical protein BX600DRAFT_477022 [Xylariales sp. PMI_506]|nr:hypothetical protein BX600DRAFT_477022 [Xylariales sp. PMI_506]